jgi:hypothetical protein
MQVYVRQSGVVDAHRVPEAEYIKLWLNNRQRAVRQVVWCWMDGRRFQGIRLAAGSCTATGSTKIYLKEGIAAPSARTPYKREDAGMLIRRDGGKGTTDRSVPRARREANQTIR